MNKVILPQRTPNWFKKYIDLNEMKTQIFYVIIAAIVTGLGAFGGFPEPPLLFKQILTYKWSRWVLLFLLVWQGGGGDGKFSMSAFLTSLVTTVIIYIVYQIPFIKNGIRGTVSNKTTLCQQIKNCKKRAPKLLEKENIKLNKFKKKLKNLKKNLKNTMNKEIPVQTLQQSYIGEANVPDVLNVPDVPDVPDVVGKYLSQKFETIQKTARKKYKLNKMKNSYSDSLPYKYSNDFW